VPLRVPVHPLRSNDSAGLFPFFFSRWRSSLFQLGLLAGEVVASDVLPSSSKRVPPGGSNAKCTPAVSPFFDVPFGRPVELAEGDNRLVFSFSPTPLSEGRHLF